MNSKNALIFAVCVIMFVGVMFDGGSDVTGAAKETIAPNAASNDRPALMAQSDYGSAPKPSRNIGPAPEVGSSVPFVGANSSAIGEYDPNKAKAAMSRVVYPGTENTRFDPTIDPGQTHYRY